MDKNQSVLAQPSSKSDEAVQDDMDKMSHVSYEDSDTHARAYCCCLHGWGSGPDPRWYYPWDKGVYRLFGLCCMWYCACAFFPCVLCCKTSRAIVCCSDQCGNKTAAEQTDQRMEEDVAEA